jgi:peptidyl-tRNA hydrolase
MKERGKESESRGMKVVRKEIKQESKEKINKLRKGIGEPTISRDES